MSSASLLVGVDEAGYGPNLGPLAVAATAWRVDTDGPLDEIDLYDRFAEIVAREPAPGRIAVADSKKLYSPGGGLDTLELGALAVHDAQPKRWSDLVERLGADRGRRRMELPWHADFDPALPSEADRDAVAAASASLAGRTRAAHARLVFPAEFNELVEKWDTKGAALSHTTLALLREIVGEADATTFCVCDKHGGRNRYGALLQHHFPDAWVETLHESRAESRYRVGRVEIAFRTGGEAWLPTAWASMIAKHLRELAMRALNAYWAERVPGIRPTAGYPVDAKRFRAEIATRQRELRIDDALIWRNR